MYLLDTDILVFSLKGHAQVNAAFHRQRAYAKVVSAVTYGELVYGARKSQKPAENLAKIRQMAEIFPVLPVTRVIMETFGEIKALLEAEGIGLDDFDLMIASTALSMNYTLVTNNEKHFARIRGLRTENWTV